MSARLTARTAAVVALAFVASGLSAVPTSAASAPSRPAVVEARTIGHTVKGRPIRAWRVGNPRSTNRVVVMSTMHGDEAATRRILFNLRDGRRVKGIDLWLIPVANPDGLARRTRKNARGVDLNRNFPYRWRNLNGPYESGRRPASEPETRALMRFFRQVRPKRIVSIHQPLHGVDVSTRESRRFGIRLARGLHLPQKRFTCSGTCYGTFTQWYMRRLPGVAVTVEYGRRPTLHRMKVAAPRALLRTLGGRR